jgi:hypothetical protein
MKSSAADEPRAPGHAPIKTRRFSISLVWIVPVVAVLVGISLVVHNLLQEGPTIVVNFKTGSGLVANKTEVKYRSVVIGQVTDVELSGDQKSVDATIKLAKQAETFTREDSEFWVVRPRIGAGGVSASMRFPAISAPTSARPTTAPSTSRGWKIRRRSLRRTWASASCCMPRISARWISVPRFTTARFRWAKS